MSSPSATRAERWVPGVRVMRTYKRSNPRSNILQVGCVFDRSKIGQHPRRQMKPQCWLARASMPRVRARAQLDEKLKAPEKS